jgi:hypothetical protein
LSDGKFTLDFTSVNPDKSIVVRFTELLDSHETQSWGSNVKNHEIIFYPDRLPPGPLPSLLRQSNFIGRGSTYLAAKTLDPSNTSSNDSGGWFIYCTVGVDGVRVVEPLSDDCPLLVLSLFMKREIAQESP